MSFLKEINRKETEKAVKEMLEEYRLLLLLEVGEEEQPSITANYSDIPSHTNKFHSSTEDVAIKNVENWRHLDQYYHEKVRRIQMAVSRLCSIEKEIITKRYMDKENKFNYEIADEVGLSDRQYSRVKSKAFYNLAFILRLVEYKVDKRVEHEHCTTNS